MCVALRYSSIVELGIEFLVRTAALTVENWWHLVVKFNWRHEYELPYIVMPCD